MMAMTRRLGDRLRPALAVLLLCGVASVRADQAPASSFASLKAEQAGLQLQQQRRLQEEMFDFGQLTKLVAEDGNFGDFFGVAVSISANILVIGAAGDEVMGPWSGSAYVFTSPDNGTSWEPAMKLGASDGASNAQFGSAVSVGGNVIVIGAPGASSSNGTTSGSAYVFTTADEGTTWTEIAKLSADDAESGDEFGKSVSVDGSIIVVGAHLDTDTALESGSAYVFMSGDGGASWSQSTKLLADDGQSLDDFGFSVSVSGDVIVVGAWQDNDNGEDSGSAYIFTTDDGGSTWSQLVKLLASDGSVGAEFGRSVSISGNVVVVGADGDGDPKRHSGSAYVFLSSDGGVSWPERAKLTASDGEAGDRFGRSVSVGGFTIVVGASSDDGFQGVDSGSAYVFRSDTNGEFWDQTDKLMPRDGGPVQVFGDSVSVDGEVVIVGAQFDNELGDYAGSAYAFGDVPHPSMAPSLAGLPTLFPSATPPPTQRPTRPPTQQTETPTNQPSPFPTAIQSTADVPRSNDDSGGPCFAASSTVRIENDEVPRRLEDLRIGDRILTVDASGAPAFSDVIFLPHGINEVPATFLDIRHTASATILSVTPSHLVASADCASGVATGLVRADALVPGEACMLTLEGAARVEAMETVSRRGIYTAVPETPGALLVVDGVVASPFAYNHAVVDAYYSVHRLAYALAPQGFAAIADTIRVVQTAMIAPLVTAAIQLFYPSATPTKSG